MITLNINSKEVRRFTYEERECSITVWSVCPKIASEEVPVGTYEAVSVRGLVQLFRMKNEDLGKPELHAKAKGMRLLGNVTDTGDREMKLYELSSAIRIFKKYTPSGGTRSDTIRRFMLYINPDSAVGKKFKALMAEIECQTPGEDWDEDRPNTERWLDYTEDQRLKAQAQKAKKKAEESGAIPQGAGPLVLNVEEQKDGGVDLSTQDMVEAKKKEKTVTLTATEALDD